MLEIEGEYREVMSLGVGHDRRVGDSQFEIPVPSVDLCSAAKQGGGEESGPVLTLDQGLKEESRCRGVHTCPKKMVSLDDDGVEHDEVATDLGDQRRGQPVGLVAAVRRSDQRACVCKNPQRAMRRSRRYFSAKRPRSRGPVPEAT